MCVQCYCIHPWTLSAKVLLVLLITSLTTCMYVSRIIFIWMSWRSRQTYPNKNHPAPSCDLFSPLGSTFLLARQYTYYAYSNSTYIYVCIVSLVSTVFARVYNYCMHKLILYSNKLLDLPPKRTIQINLCIVRVWLVWIVKWGSGVTIRISCSVTRCSSDTHTAPVHAMGVIQLT